MRHLHELFTYLQADNILVANPLPEDTLLVDLITDSRQVSEGCIFIALPGTQNHGNQYAEKSVAFGAVGIITDSLDGLDILQLKVPVFLIENLAAQLPRLASWFYHHPSQKIQLLGITGTNGKTSTAFYTAQLLTYLTGKSIALIGTLGNGLVSLVQAEDATRLNVDLETTANTTPEVVTLNRLLARFVNLGVVHCVMEVSSHAIELQRIGGLQFQGVALTQVTRDHLDFHKTEEAYRNVKAKLFTEVAAKFQVLNLADSLGQTLLRADPDVPQITYSLDTNRTADLQLKDLKLTVQGMEFECIHRQQNYPVSVRLMGGFNAENLACAMSLCLGLGFSLESILQHLAKLQAVTGRMQKVSNCPTVLVDYAHTPDALDVALTAIRQHLLQDTGSKVSQLWVVFGCGGNRDRGKRPLMGAVAERLADHVILTDDNPRCEASFDIINDIQQGMQLTPMIIPDRQAAIETALKMAAQDDMILIAGKGHETYQAFCNEQFYFSDQACVQAWKKQHDLES